MKRNDRLLLAFLLFLPFFASCRSARPPTLQLSRYPGTIRIACVGDSITYGAGVEGRETNCYPAVLGRLLGPKFQVQNFGVSGATLQKRGDKPYWSEPAFLAITEFKPDVVIIQLGTNDTKPQNWRNQAEFAGDMRALIEHFRQLRERPAVWVCLPVPVYETQWGINAATLEKEIIPSILRLSDETRVPLIDLHHALSNRPDMFPDKIHPNVAGAERMAQTINAALLGR